MIYEFRLTHETCFKRAIIVGEQVLAQPDSEQKSTSWTHTIAPSITLDLRSSSICVLWLLWARSDFCRWRFRRGVNRAAVEEKRQKTRAVVPCPPIARQTCQNTQLLEIYLSIVLSQEGQLVAMSRA